MSVWESDQALLWDMLQAARLIQDTLIQISREQFLEDRRVDRAILWSIGSAEVSSLIAALDPLVPPPPEES